MTAAGGQILKNETKEKIAHGWILLVTLATSAIIAITAIAWLIGLIMYTFRLIRRIYG